MPAKKSASKVLSPPPDPYVAKLLERITAGKEVLTFSKGEVVFSQGGPTDAIFFIQSGKVKISVASTVGKDAVLAILSGHAFFGEGSLVGQSLRVSTATALERTTVFRVDKATMLRALRDEADLSDKFIAAVLVRNIELEDDLCDQLFNHSEKRLARVLLKLSRLREHGAVPDATIPMLSHETLAGMVGTTRSRATHFMNKFRAMGLIDYGKTGLTVRTELLTDLVLHD
jgi:CRP-like cAMP-binding protein